MLMAVTSIKVAGFLEYAQSGSIAPTITQNGLIEVTKGAEKLLSLLEVPRSNRFGAVLIGTLAVDPSVLDDYSSIGRVELVRNSKSWCLAGWSIVPPEPQPMRLILTPRQDKLADPGMRSQYEVSEGEPVVSRKLASWSSAIAGGSVHISWALTGGNVGPSSSATRARRSASLPAGTSVTLLDLLVPTYVKMLKALSGWLEKAEAQMADNGPDTLLSARLAADMFPLATQVRFACVQAEEGVFRLRGQAFPASIELLLEEGRNATYCFGSIADARARISEAMRVVEDVASEAIDVAPTTPVARALPRGTVFDLTAEQYARDWALPQFFFHVMIAYAILCAEGVDLGKADYIAHMLAYLRRMPP